MGTEQALRSRRVPIAVAGILALIVLPLIVLTQYRGNDPDDPMPIAEASAVVQQVAGEYCAEECPRWAIYDPEAGWWYQFAATVDRAQALEADGFTVKALPDEPTLAQHQAEDNSTSRSVSELIPWWVWPLLLVVIVVGAGLGSLGNGRPG